MKEHVMLGRDDPPESGRLADDATLIERSRADPEAFAAIFDRHATEIHGYAERRLGAALAEDVVGETFLTAFRRRDRYDLTYRDAKPWLFGIATNMISRHHQAEVRFYRALARTGVDPVVESPADDVVARVAATGQRRAIAAALARLSQPDRDTVLLVDWAELSYDQAASTTVIPHVPNAVGRVGVAVSRSGAALIFDPATYQLIGEGAVLTKAVPGEGPAGTVTASTAQLQVRVVDSPPHVPPSQVQKDSATPQC